MEKKSNKNHEWGKETRIQMYTTLHIFCYLRQTNQSCLLVRHHQ